MVLVSVAELVPAAQALVGTLGVATMVFLGGAFLGLANFAIPHGHLVTEHGLDDTRLIRSAYMVVAGLILHDVPEGFAMANAYIASPSLGLLVAIAIALHNLPEELAMAIPALAIRSKRFLIGAAINNVCVRRAARSNRRSVCCERKPEPERILHGIRSGCDALCVVS
jgi:ZIP family zinc transporter